MGRAKPPKPSPPAKETEEAGQATNEEVHDPAGEDQAAKEDLPILSKGHDGASKGGGSTSAAVAAGKGVSQMSMLLGKTVLQAPLGGSKAQDSDSGAGKRGRDEKESPEDGNPQAEKKPKKPPLNLNSLRAIVREEAELTRAANRADLAEAIETALSGKAFRQTIREEVRSVLGFGPSETFQEAVGSVYTGALRTGLTDVMRAIASKAGFPGEVLRTDPVAVAKWSSLEASLANLEKLVKSKADADTLREAKNILSDLKSATDNLKVGGTNLEQKLDHIRSLLASLPPPPTQAMMQPYAQNPSYAAPWQPQQHTSSGGGPGMAPGPQQNPAPTFPPTMAAAPLFSSGTTHQGTSASRSNAPQAPVPQGRRAYDNDFPKNQLLAIRTTNTERSLPHTSPAMQNLLRKAEYPDNAINAAECYIPLRSGKTGPSDAILTFKVCFPSASMRAGFLDLAQNPKVVKMLNALELSIEEWKDKADLMLERQMRFSANIARNAENELAAQFSRATSAFAGPK